MVNSVKFLGVTLDSKLNYNEHIIKITTKATAALMQTKRALSRYIQVDIPDGRQTHTVILCSHLDKNLKHSS